MTGNSWHWQEAMWWCGVYTPTTPRHIGCCMLWRSMACVYTAYTTCLHEPRILILQCYYMPCRGCGTVCNILEPGHPKQQTSYSMSSGLMVEWDSLCLWSSGFCFSSAHHFDKQRWQAVGLEIEVKQCTNMLAWCINFHRWELRFRRVVWFLSVFKIVQVFQCTSWKWDKLLCFKNHSNHFWKYPLVFTFSWGWQIVLTSSFVDLLTVWCAMFTCCVESGTRVTYTLLMSDIWPRGSVNFMVRWRRLLYF